MKVTSSFVQVHCKLSFEDMFEEHMRPDEILTVISLRLQLLQHVRSRPHRKMLLDMSDTAANRT